MTKDATRSEQMKNNTRACKGFPTRRNHERYPLTEGLPLLCSTCHVSGRCLKFQAGAICAYRKDYTAIDLATRDPAAIAEEMSRLAATQRNRVQSGMLFEHLMLGGRPDPDVGAEVERMTRILNKLIRLQLSLKVAAPQVPQADGLFATLFPEVFGSASTP